jgi:hypothetical protein
MVNTFVLTSDKETLFTYLDDKRTGKQRLEAAQIIRILEKYDETEKLEGAYSKHPAVLMWLGYTNALKVYFNLCVKEWISRGFNNSYKFYDLDEDDYRIVQCEFDGETCVFAEEFDEFCFPPWFSFPPFILSHRAALLRKNPSHYDDFNTDEIKEYYDKGYLWPHKQPEEMYEEWKFEYLDPIGQGAPVQFRVTQEDTIKWISNKNINPKTGRKIKTGAKLYKEYEEAAQYYELLYSIKECELESI